MIRPRSRVATGFHRIGLAVALPLVLSGVILGANEFWRALPAKQPGLFDSFPDAKSAPPAASKPGLFDHLLEPKSSKQADPFDDLIANNPPPNATKAENYFDRFDEPASRKVEYGPAAILIGLGALAYAIFRALGWIIDGFTGADRA